MPDHDVQCKLICLIDIACLAAQSSSAHQPGMHCLDIHQGLCSCPRRVHHLPHLPCRRPWCPLVCGSAPSIAGSPAALLVVRWLGALSDAAATAAALLAGTAPCSAQAQHLCLMSGCMMWWLLWMRLLRMRRPCGRSIMLISVSSVLVMYRT